jgi:D-threo-aldose 1-dehydrogenase
MAFFAEASLGNIDEDDDVFIDGGSGSGLYATGPVAGAPFNYREPSPGELERARRIEAVCRRHNVALAAAALQFPLHHPSVASVIPGGFRPEHVTSNISYMRDEIPDALWAELKREKLIRLDAPSP